MVHCSTGEPFDTNVEIVENGVHYMVEDISEFAVQQAADNAKRNGLENTVKFRCANVLDELPKLYEAGVIGKDY